MEFSPIKTRSILGARNKSQRWLAEAAGLHVNTIYNLLSGDKTFDSITISTVNSIAAALECDPLDLMNENGDDHANT
jgi:DNA-binding Xre family transcriptional regulator